MSRKDIFANLKPMDAETDKQQGNPQQMRGRVRPLIDQQSAAAPSPTKKLVSSVGQALLDVNERSKRADEIEKLLAAGQTVVSLDTGDIDPSFIQDRMPGDIDGLLESIRTQGQQVPILVRPHPQDEGRYQVAFGHRRLRAIKELGLKVNAIVRELSDEQLVVAQGQENNERQDLTYIEKARFADRLQQRFSRDVIMAAMSIYKSDLSNMLSVVTRIPGELIDAIGPAPGIGRRSWIELAATVSEPETVQDAIAFAMSQNARVLLSEDRFKALVAHLKPRPGKTKGSTEIWSARTGERLAKVTENGAKIELVIDRNESPAFAAFVLGQLKTLFEEHRSAGSDIDQQTHGE